MTIGTRSLGVVEERALAAAIEGLDREASDHLGRVPAAARVLEQSARSRGAAWDRLADALAAAAADPRADRETLRSARENWEAAAHLRWQLALSARDTLAREARRLEGNAALSRADLEQEGWLGLFAAACRFDGRRGIRFSTYARWWARAAMTSAVDRARAVRLPASAAEQLRNLKKRIRELEVTRGPHWEFADAARSVGLAAERARVLYDGGSTVPLEGASPDDAERAVEPADPGPGTEELSEARETAARLAVALARESPRTRAILTRRHGLDGGDPESLDRIAARVGVSRERVRQLQRAALERLAEACATRPASGR